MTTIDVKQIEDETNVAIALADAHANPEWKREAEAALMILVRQGRDFSADDIHALMKHSGLKTKDNRALGGIFLRASKDGLIYPTGGFRKSVRRETHRRPLTVWRPLSYKKRWFGLGV